MTEPVRCEDCFLPYSSFGLDLVLPDDQWERICPGRQGGGLLCATCIMRRCARLPGASVAIAQVNVDGYRPMKGRLDTEHHVRRAVQAERQRCAEVVKSFRNRTGGILLPWPQAPQAEVKTDRRTWLEMEHAILNPNDDAGRPDARPGQDGETVSPTVPRTPTVENARNHPGPASPCETCGDSGLVDASGVKGCPQCKEFRRRAGEES